MHKAEIDTNMLFGMINLLLSANDRGTFNDREQRELTGYLDSLKGPLDTMVGAMEVRSFRYRIIVDTMKKAIGE